MFILGKRRHALVRAVLAGSVFLLSACGGEEDPGGGNSSGAGSSSSSSSSSSSGASSGQPSHAVLSKGGQLYEAQCAVCHGDKGEGTTLGIPIRPEQEWSSVARLVEKIDTTMPPGGADSKCDLTCAKQLSAYILAGYKTVGQVHPEIVFEEEKPKQSTLKGLAALPDSTASKAYSARDATTIPMMIQAEHFDVGGAGVSYRDTTPGNVGSQPMVRDETDVDFGRYDGGVVSIGWFESGEWVDYSFYLDQAAIIDVHWQVAAASNDRSFKWYVNGIEQSTLTVPNTGSWGAFVGLRSISPYLEKGWHTIRVASLASFNLDFLKLRMAERQPVDTVALDYQVEAKVLHRLTKIEYLNTVNDVFGGDFSEIVSEFESDAFGEGFDRVAEVLKVDFARLEKLMEAAFEISTKIINDDAMLSRVLDCNLTGASLNTCGAKLVEKWGLKLARRPLTQVELTRHLALLQDRLNAGASGKQAVQHWLRAMLVSPSFLHHVEREPASDLETDTFTLSPYELANRLSYFMWCQNPDKTLYDLAESGELVQDAVLSAQIDRMLADPKSRCLVDTIALQWLRLAKIEDVTSVVSADSHAGWVPQLAKDMLDETKTFVMHLIKQNRPVSEMLSANYTFMSPELASFYGLNAPNAVGRVDLSGSQRKGLLTQGSILTLTGNGRADVHRGIFVLKNLLCDPPPPPPDNIDTTKGTGGDECQGCHRFIDPVGDGLAHFDDIGRFADVDAMGNAISAEGNFFNGASFNGAIEMIDVLQSDQRVPACVVENFLSYALAAEPDNIGRRVKDSMVAEWEKSGLGFKDMLKTIVSSPAFKYRRLMSAEQE